jgi:general secretion pathway protein J
MCPVSRQQSGFTLVEVLVVLTLISMLSALLFQGFGYMLATYDRLQDRQSEEFRQNLVQGWWRDSLESAVPYYENRLRFSGDALSIHGASYEPLWRKAGIPSEISWRLERRRDELHLVYEEPPYQPVSVQRWGADARAAFSFLSESGEWQMDWLPSRDRQLPEAVQLIIEEGRGAEQRVSVLTAVVPIRKSQFVPVTDILYGRE